MKVRMLLAVVTGIASLFSVSTQNLRAAAATDSATGEKLHVVSKAELHDAVLASSAEATAARKSVQDFLARPEVQSQIERMEFEPAVLASRVALLSDSELRRLHSQVMTADQQIKTAGFPGWAIVVITVVVVLVILIIIGLVTYYQS